MLLVVVLALAVLAGIVAAFYFSRARSGRSGDMPNSGGRVGGLVGKLRAAAQDANGGRGNARRAFSEPDNYDDDSGPNWATDSGDPEALGDDADGSTGAARARRRMGFRKGAEVDEELWPTEAFGGVSDEQFWDDLAADRPLATTARTAQQDPGRRAGRSAPRVEPRGRDQTARRPQTPARASAGGRAGAGSGAGGAEAATEQTLVQPTVGATQAMSPLGQPVTTFTPAASARGSGPQPVATPLRPVGGTGPQPVAARQPGPSAPRGDGRRPGGFGAASAGAASPGAAVPGAAQSGAAQSGAAPDWAAQSGAAGAGTASFGAAGSAAEDDPLTSSAFSLREAGPVDGRSFRTGPSRAVQSRDYQPGEYQDDYRPGEYRPGPAEENRGFTPGSAGGGYLPSPPAPPYLAGYGSAGSGQRGGDPGTARPAADSYGWRSPGPLDEPRANGGRRPGAAPSGAGPSSAGPSSAGPSSAGSAVSGPNGVRANGARPNAARPNAARPHPRHAGPDDRDRGTRPAYPPPGGRPGGGHPGSGGYPSGGYPDSSHSDGGYPSGGYPGGGQPGGGYQANGYPGGGRHGGGHRLPYDPREDYRRLAPRALPGGRRASRGH